MARGVCLRSIERSLSSNWAAGGVIPTSEMIDSFPIARWSDATRRRASWREAQRRLSGNRLRARTRAAERLDLFLDGVGHKVVKVRISVVHQKGCVILTRSSGHACAEREIISH